MATATEQQPPAHRVVKGPKLGGNWVPLTPIAGTGCENEGILALEVAACGTLLTFPGGMTQWLPLVRVLPNNDQDPNGGYKLGKESRR